jgi:hypothetical protein
MADSFTQTIDLFLNVKGRQFPAVFFASRTSTAAAQLQFVHGDTVLLRLWLCAPPPAFGRTSPLYRVTGGIAFAIKASTAPTAPLLAFASDFTLVDPGEAQHYEATLNLATAEMHAATASGNTLTARLDIELQSPGNARRITFAAPVQIVRDAYQGVEVEPVPATPAYPPPGDIPSKNEVDALIDDKVAAQLPPLLAAAMTQTASEVAAVIPRITRVAVATLAPGAEATASFTTPDPTTPNAPASGTLSLGIPRGADGVVSSVPSGFVSATAAIPQGADIVPVAFLAPFASVPMVAASLASPGSYAPVIAFVLGDFTAAGFSVRLAAPAPTVGYTITYIAIAPA